MNLDDVAKTLPNGFHDSELHRFEMDYAGRTLHLDLDVWIGDMDDVARREAYRPGRLSVLNVAYLLIEPPDERYAWLKLGAIRVDSGSGVPVETPYKTPSHLVGCFVGYFYLGS